MPDPPFTNNPPRQIGVFELGWLRHTDSLADPRVRARSLCGEIAQVVRADRVSLLSTEPSGAQLLATSHTASLDPRASETLRLEKIAMEVRSQGRDVSTLPRESPTRDRQPDCLEWLAVPITHDAQANVRFVLVLQRYVPQPEGLDETLAPIRSQVGSAVGQITASGEFSHHRSTNRLLSTWKSAGRTARLGILLLLGAVLFVGCLLPVPFRLHVRGQIEPSVVRGIFAPAAGTLARLHVDDGQAVRAGDLLAETRSTEIQLQYDRITGERAAAETELATERLSYSDSASQVNSPETSGRSVHRSSARQMVLRARIESLSEQSELIQDVKESLSIRSPIDGYVILRDSQSDLVGQNIMQSQWLMQVVDTQHGYDAVMNLPEKDYGYLHTVMQHRGAPVTAKLRLLSSPETTFTATASQIADTVHWTEGGLAAVEVRMHVPESLPANIHVGATVVGSISAGRRSLGFVLFRPVIESLRSYGW